MNEPRRGTRLGAGSFEFSFDGRPYRAQPGDTVASALLANGIRLIGRSIKYRRGRGFLTAGPEEPNGLVTVGTAPHLVPNVPGPQLELKPGMNVASQNRWPTLSFDLASSLQLARSLLGAGFYYKTFMWPSWRFYEPMIRRLAGLGLAPGACNIPPPEVSHLEPDVLVAGAGAAGLAAALAAARAGARVILSERDVVCGGELEFESATISGQPAAAWVDAVIAEITERDGVILTSTAVIGGTNGVMVAVKQPGGLPGSDTLFRIRPRAFVIAMGSVERPLAFMSNDLPGVMMLGAAERYLARQGVRVGRQVVLFGNNERLYFAARRLLASGVRVQAIIDVRSPAAATATQTVRRMLEREGIECLMGHTVVRAVGWRQLSGVQVSTLDSASNLRVIACDTLLMSGGWSPAIHAGLSEGGSTTYVSAAVGFGAGAQPGWRRLCGAADGIVELGEVLADGHAAGVAAAQAAVGGSQVSIAPVGMGDGAPNVQPYWRAPATVAGEKLQFVDFQNDVTVADLRQAVAEGFTDIEHVKRYTTLGVGTEQGRTSAVIGAGILAELSGRQVADVGHFRLRPPYQPTTLKALAGIRSGTLLRPVRRTPLHAWHSDNGAVFEPMGLWMRPRCYGGGGTNVQSAGLSEAARVRSHGGVFDGSTLGKIEVAGRDAAAFLDRMYLMRASTLKIGRSKYVVNLREDGMVFDDGIALRLGSDRFLVTTSTGHADSVLSHFEFYRATEWSKKNVSSDGCHRGLDGHRMRRPSESRNAVPGARPGMA